MALYFFVLISIPSIALFRKKFKHPHIDEVEKIGVKEDKNSAKLTDTATIIKAEPIQNPISFKDTSLLFQYEDAAVSPSFTPIFSTSSI